MFSKDSKTTTPSPAPAPAPVAAEPNRTTSRSAAPSIISPDLKIKGDLVCNGDVQIDGSVEGDVVSRTITVGEGADIRGSISAESVRVCGSVNGQVKGNTVTLAKTAKVIGDIMHQTLSIEPGAFFEGQVRRIDSSQTSDSRVSPIKPSASGGSTSSASQATAR